MSNTSDNQTTSSSNTSNGNGFRNIGSSSKKKNKGFRRSFGRGWCFPFRTFGSPQQAFAEFCGFFCICVVIWGGYEAIRFGIKDPAVRARTPRNSVAQTFIYLGTEVVLEGKNQMLTGHDNNQAEPLPDPYEESEKVEASAK